MLRPKTQKPNNTLIWIIVAVLMIAGIITIVLAFNNPSEAGEDEINAAYTSAAETFSAQQLTLQAASSPTWTPDSATSTTTATPTLFATLTTTSQIILSSPTSSVAGGNTALGCDNSVYVADVTIPDNTVMAPGQAFKKTWKIQNNGTCPWTNTYTVTFLSGNKMNGIAEPITVTVEPGSSADLTVNMTAPTTNGDAVSYWKLSNANNQQFGTSFYVLIKVGGSTVTGTITTTATTGVIPSTATTTLTPTQTLTPTVTSTP
jgi:uncharacterized cupredoxin-like copper-binding protein